MPFTCHHQNPCVFIMEPGELDLRLCSPTSSVFVLFPVMVANANEKRISPSLSLAPQCSLVSELGLILVSS